MMAKKIVASLSCAIALALATPASAAVMVFQGHGVVSSFSKETVWPGIPDVSVGDPVAVSFTYDTTRCEIVGDTCYGGDSAPGSGFAFPGGAQFTVDGWTTTISGFTYVQIAPGAYNYQDGGPVLLVHLPTPAGASLTTGFSGTSGTASLNNGTGDIYRIGVDLQAFDLHDAAVPEPATWSTMILGLLGLGVALRRRCRFNFGK